MDSEQLDEIVQSVNRLASSICPSAAPSPDAAGGYVSSLTEAGMGITNALMHISASIDNLAEAVREHN